MRPAWLVQQQEEEAASALTAGQKDSEVISTSEPEVSFEKDEKKTAAKQEAKVAGEDAEPVGQADDADMMAMLGFGSFGSTAGAHVASNDGAAKGAVSKAKQRKYRQYMNRTNGFNQSLDGGAV